jgi:predicted DNA-binding protein
MAKQAKKQQITILLEPEQMQGLKTLSDQTLAPIAALIRDAIKKYLELRKSELKK